MYGSFRTSLITRGMSDVGRVADFSLAARWWPGNADYAPLFQLEAG